MDNMNTTEMNTGSKFHPKIIYVILGLVLVGEIMWGMKVLLTSPSPSTSIAPKVQALQAGNISVTAKNNEYSVGSPVLVSITLDAGGHKTGGSDVILHFDPKILEATNSAITKGKLYSNYSKFEVDPKAGLVTISGISVVDKSNFTGSGVLALVNFKAKAPGKTSLTIDFTEDSLKDSNIIDAMTGKDILGSVTNLDLTIK